MNSKMKRLMLPYMLLASGALNPEIYELNSINSSRITVKPEWERKKCKSCKLFPCHNNKHLYRANPKAQACDKYVV